MTQIKKGDVIIATGVKSGTGGKGAYFLCKVGDRASDKITIWNNDGFECNEGDEIRIVDIMEVKKSARKYNEKWYEEYSIVAVLESITNDKHTSANDFEELYEDEDPDRLPF